jgi:hypothetical protein
VFQLHDVLSDKINYSNTFLIQLLCLFSNCETMSVTLASILLWYLTKFGVLLDLLSLTLIDPNFAQ